MCAYDYMVKKCDDVVDIWKELRNLDVQPFNSSELDTKKNCKTEFIGVIQAKVASVFPCEKNWEETTYEVDVVAISADQINKCNETLCIDLINEGPVTEIKLVPDFPSEQYLGTFGGVLTLGGKFQVVFQFLVFIFLYVGHLFIGRR